MFINKSNLHLSLHKLNLFRLHLRAGSVGADSKVPGHVMDLQSNVTPKTIVLEIVTLKHAVMIEVGTVEHIDATDGPDL